MPQPLLALEKAHAVVLKTYRLTANFPTEEKYGLVSQMRRAAISISANLAEGTRRRTSRDRRNFLAIADGSLQELKYYFIVSRDLGLIGIDSFNEISPMANEIGKMIHGLSKYLENNPVI